MSLQNDMDMYYRDTYIGYRLDSEVIVPFYIHHVRSLSTEDGTEDFFHNEEDQYGPDAYEDLVFTGHIVTNSSGSTENKRVIGFSNDRLVFDNPDLGFITCPRSNKLVWITYTPQRSIKKGVTNRRIGRSLNERLAWNIWDAGNNGRLHPDFKKDGVLLWYKTVCIGRYTDDTSISIDHEAKFLKKLIEEVTSCQISFLQEEVD